MSTTNSPLYKLLSRVSDMRVPHDDHHQLRLEVVVARHNKPYVRSVLPVFTVYPIHLSLKYRP